MHVTEINSKGGPRTEEGKKRSSRNAITHGLFAKQLVLLPGETQEEFDALHDGFKQDHEPYGTTEEAFVLRLAILQWRLDRIVNLEGRALQNALETGDTECKFLNNYGMYSQRLSRDFQSTLKALHLEQAKRLLEHGQDYRMAVLIRDHYKRQGIDWDPAADQFVFSRQLLDKQIAFNRQWDCVTKNVHIYSTTKYQDEHFSREVPYHRLQPVVAA